MHVHFLDPYHQRTSPLHSMDGRVKLLLTLGYLVAAALLPAGAWPVFALFLGLAAAAEWLSGLSFGYYWKRSLVALPFALAAVPLVFTAGPPYWQTWGAVSLSLPGLERLISIALKSWLSVQAALLLVTTTRFPDLLAAMRSLRLPRLLVAVIGLMWRYLFVLVDEAGRLNRARQSRSGALPGCPPGGSLPWRARTTGGMVGSLMVRSLDRGDRVYQAMAARGYDGEARSLPLPPLTRADSGLLLAAGALLLALLLVAALGWG